MTTAASRKPLLFALLAAIAALMASPVAAAPASTGHAVHYSWCPPMC